MSDFVRRWVKRIKLAAIWVRRILFAEDHFNQGLFRRLQMSVHGYVPDQYMIYDFAHNDRHEYLSEFDWYRSRYINEPFDQMLNNKVMCSEVLEHYIDVPTNLFMRNKGRMVSLEPDAADGYRDVSDVLELLKHHDFVYMKPLAAGKGKGVHRLELIDGKPAVDWQSMEEDEFASFLTETDGWFLCEGVKQHPFLDSIYDKTSNTIRIITLRDPNTGDYKVFFAVLRIGTSGTVPVDNGSRGGLVSRIDLETGELSEAKTLQSLDVFETHPDTGAQIKGLIVPGWDNVKEQMLALVRQFPFLNFVAWDVLLTEEGLCVIEANTSSGVNIIQLWGPQRYGELGDFYRAHGVIK